MIPKTINYCWFGKNPLPKSAKKCIASWKKYLPDYEIKEWNEDNFDVNINTFTKEAYNNKKYAFVSDYARLWIIYNYGGIYFDTDVEVIREMDDILDKGPFMAFEKHLMYPEMAHYVALGLGFAGKKKNPIIKEIMVFYEKSRSFHNDVIPIVQITTDVLKLHGLYESDIPILIDGGFTIYPWEYFCPIEYLSNNLEITTNTRTIHHYTESWMDWKLKLKTRKGAFISKTKIWINGFVKKRKN
ncbi:glycosyltransferase family 32 protein [Plebeiibacterium sediminum]|uniref:Glycosyltransferase n=1 Tax=Plebeiibacterium sediminum TaxID=2992112 RepID=A0AAE3M436_9BACT|nr:glycosyltransferase [Plebeiobacterium sediminum]MCW3786651.1 glycosyltransferase [Plebeiobacterium sediminum]